MQIIPGQNVPIKAWVDGVEFEDAARQQAHNLTTLPFIHDHVAIMADVHAGYGSTIGSVIATRAAIIPAAVSVDIGCGCLSVCTSLKASDLPDSLASLRSHIEAAVPHGGLGPESGWGVGAVRAPATVLNRWGGLAGRFDAICDRYPDFRRGNSVTHLGSLGSGNHFIEVCLDTEDAVWVMLHSGSRGIGNLIGRTFIETARERMASKGINLPDRDLAWLDEGTQEFDDYVEAVSWAQDFALQNRNEMLANVLNVMHQHFGGFALTQQAIQCHHNYVEKEHHFGADVWLTRKGAVSARKGQLGIIPGSMGAKSYIVRGKGEPESFHSCSHGAGRRMSRGQAKREFTLADMAEQTAGIECRKDADVIDEIPGAYKSIDKVMEAQRDLVEVVAQLRQVLCVKG